MLRVILQSVTFEIFGKWLEGIGFDANNCWQEDMKIFKSDNFENCKRFVPAEVQNLWLDILNRYESSVYLCVTYLKVVFLQGMAGGVIFLLVKKENNS